MWGRLGPRFALEAAFLILLALALAFSDLGTIAIVAVMAGGWLLVSLIELIASREPRYPAPAREVRVEEQEVVAGEPEPVPEPTDAEVQPEPAPVEPAPVALANVATEEAEPARRRRRWFRREPPPVEEPPAPVDKRPEAEKGVAEAPPAPDIPAAEPATTEPVAATPADEAPPRRRRWWFGRGRGPADAPGEAVSEPPRHVRRIETSADEVLEESPPAEGEAERDDEAAPAHERESQAG